MSSVDTVHQHAQVTLSAEGPEDDPHLLDAAVVGMPTMGLPIAPPEADEVTVGFDLEQRWSLDRSSLYVDGALLERIGSN